MLCVLFSQFIHFFTNNAIFYSFNYSFNNAVKIFIQRIYSFKKSAKYSFNEFIHPKKNENYSFKENIHSSEKWIIAQGYTPFTLLIL